MSNDGFCSGPARSYSSVLILFFFFPSFFLYAKKKDQKERRRSAPVCVRTRTGRRGRFFRESPHGHKWKLGALRAPQVYRFRIAGRINAAKPPTPLPFAREIDREGLPHVIALAPFADWSTLIFHRCFCRLLPANPCCCNLRPLGTRASSPRGAVADFCRGNPCGCPREGDVIGNGLRQAKSQRTLAELRLTPACCFHPPYQKAKRATKAIIPRRTVGAERAVPFSTLDRCSSVAGRAADRVHPVRKFALCIWQAPRLAATFGSFWSLQKELAEGRESGEKWILNLIFPFPTFLRRRQGIWGDVDLESGFCLLLQADG